MDEVSTRVAASPQRVWDLISDITRMGEWSPENRGGRWRGEATGAALGAKFFGYNRRGPVWWLTTCTVIECDPPRAFAFEVLRSTRWGYRLEQDGDGTVVTEWREKVRPVPLPFRVPVLLGLVGRDRDRLMLDGMRATLERVKAAAEAAEPADAEPADAEPIEPAEVAETPDKP